MLRMLVWLTFALVSLDSASAQPLTGGPIRIASPFPSDTPIGISVNDLARRLKERLGERFPVSVVAQEGPMLSMLSSKRAEVAIASTSDLGEIAPTLALFDLPLLFSNITELSAVQSSSAGQAPMGDLQRKGIVALAYMNNGINTLLTRTRPDEIAAFQGKKIRVTTRSGASAVSQLGATPVNLPFAEITAAATAGALDGLETSPRVASQLFPSDGARPFTAAIQIRPSVSTVIIQDTLWQQLPYRVQAILSEETEKASKQAAELAARQDSEALSSLSERSKITQVSLRQFSESIKPVWSRASGVDPSLLNSTVLPIIERVRLETGDPPNSPQRDRRGSVSDPPQIKEAAVVGPRGLRSGEVLFATDRAFEAAPEPDYRVSGRRGPMTFGLARLDIKPTRRMGATDDGSAPLAGLTQYSPSEFTARLRAALAAASKKEVVIFVHGFNNSFEGATRALALMSADIHFGGVPVLFSWPSDGAAPRYGSDEEEVRASRDNFLRFVELVRQTTGLERLHVAAHSMGNRLVFEAIDRFDATERGKDTKLFYHAVMAAPDLYVQVFETGAEAFRRRVGRTTLYASEKDAALVCSRTLHAGNRRLGEAGPRIFVAAYLETIDATEAEPRPSIFSVEAWGFLHWFLKPCEKGHAYMMRSLRIQADLQNLILTDLPPGSRHGLEKKDKNGADYWAFRPSG